ncbi:hypothetical protein IGK25_002728 [Enterococcus sp. DIV1614a]|uniref:hypothetical protein n=1 Tax=Enterococcus sp. DIV1614a TaxID=2774817 RepID=UPI00156E235F|nr:hypothetical protein [Enterococcus faecalis]NSN51404.1 hypothetical protein [Enterococcus faecalis]
MKKMFILSVLLLSTVGVLTNPIVVKAEEVDNQEEIVVDSQSTTMTGAERATINCYAKLTKSGLTFVGTSTTSKAMDSIWTKCNSYTSGRQLINSNQNTVYGSTYGSAQANIGAIHTNARARAYHTYKKAGYNTVELITSYNW